MTSRQTAQLSPERTWGNLARPDGETSNRVFEILEEWDKEIKRLNSPKLPVTKAPKP
jgi:hypothetical protein